MRNRWGCALAILVLSEALLLWAQAPEPKGGGGGGAKGSNVTHQLVERVIGARKEYQEALEALRTHYITTQDIEHARWAEDELLQFHRMGKQAFSLDLDVPPPNLQGIYNIPPANDLMRQALLYKDKGWGTDYIDNQRRAELLLQRLLTKHPQSDKISEAAYLLGDLYESKAFRQNQRAAIYFERCYQWHPQTQHDARQRAARLYEKLGEKVKASEIYTEITTHETDPKRIDEAKAKVAELKGGK